MQLKRLTAVAAATTAVFVSTSHLQLEADLPIINRSLKQT